MSATVRASLAWSDIQSMPPGQRRDELTYAYRTRITSRQAVRSAVVAGAEAMRREAEIERTRAILAHHDTPADQAHRRHILHMCNPRKAS